MSAELHWFPLYYADWLSSPAIAAMLPEQEGAYLRLLMLAWGNGEAEPSLPADDAALARLSRLGSRWKKLGALVRAQFDARDGRLFNVKLSAVWAEQQEKHGRRVRAGSMGGRRAAEKRQQSAVVSPDATARATASATGPASSNGASNAGSNAGGNATSRASSNLEVRTEKRDLLPERVGTSGAVDLDQERAAAAPLEADPAPAAAALALGYGDLPEAAIRFVQRFYPRGTDADRRRDVADQLIATLGDGARLNGSARRVRAFTAERLAAKCAEVLTSPPKDTDKAIVVLLRKLADTSDGSAPGHVAEREAAVERARDERTGAERAALAEAWLSERPDVATAIEALLDAEPNIPQDRKDPIRRVMWRAKVVESWSAAGEPEVQHA